MGRQKIAFIGGTGVYEQSRLDERRELTISTRYGPVFLQSGRYENREVYFLARHGDRHSVPPHLVNYRANIAALKELGIEAVIATAAVGSLREGMAPGSRVVIDQFIDFTKGRPSTFYEGEEGEVVHTDFTQPYCPQLRAAILRAGRKLNQQVIDGGCYICTEGPRFETPAEIKMFALFGADLVGMTNVPEVTLAREAGLCYATIALVTNFAAGISTGKLSHEEVLEVMVDGKSELDLLLMSSLTEIPTVKTCECELGGRHWPTNSGTRGGVIK